ncbi:MULTISPECIES: hypothetical protein [Haloarcula]|uniref:hypothetical protein n=1 Tax=Haloarcula TaxID=2237 RepID=UPI0023E7C5C9|nr:hypothetical protein [Halomicroarcula sp. SHR3]
MSDSLNSSVFPTVLASVSTFVFGVSTAIYLEEYLPSSGLLRTATRLMNVNISNLAGVATLLIVLLSMNSVAILVRNKYQQEAY